MAKHRQEATGSRHPGVSWEYANASARTSASGFDSYDVGGFAWQQDDDSIWVLIATTPTWSQVGGSGTTDNDAIHNNVDGEINAITSKSSLVSGDLFLIEDSASSYAKKKAQPGSISHTLLADKGSNTHSQIDTHIGSTSNPHSVTYTQAGAAASSHTHTESDITDLDHTDSNAIHDNVSAEISAITEKSSPVSADVILGEDSANSWSKIRIPYSSFGSGGGTTYVPFYIHGLNIAARTSGDVFTIYPGVCVNDAEDTYISSSSNITVYNNTTGANALDTGTIAANTWYNAFLIYNPTTETTAGLFSTSRTSPTMPSGYTKKRFIGSLRTDGDADFLYGETQGYGPTKCMLYEELVSVLVAGTETDWTNVSCSDYIPDGAMTGYFRVSQGASSGVVFFKDPDATRNWIYLDKYQTTIRCGLDSSRNIAYRVTGSGSGNIGILGYWEDLTY